MCEWKLSGKRLVHNGQTGIPFYEVGFWLVELLLAKQTAQCLHILTGRLAPAIAMLITGYSMNIYLTL